MLFTFTRNLPVSGNVSQEQCTIESYTDNINTSTASNTANETELTVTLDSNNKQKDMDVVKCEIKLEDEEMYIDECGPTIEETEDEYVNVEESFVKEENTWKREEADDYEEHPMYNNSTDNVSVNTTKNDAELTVTLDNMDEVKCEIKLEDEEMHSAECGPIIDETEDVYVNFEDSFVKEEDTWKREQADDYEEHPIDNNSTDYKSNSEISVNTTANEAELTVTLDLNNKQKNMNEVKCEIKLEDEEMCKDDSGSSIEEPEYVYVIFIKETDDEEEHPLDNNSTVIINDAPVTGTDTVATNTAELNAAAKEPYLCSTCSKSFVRNCDLIQHRRLHTGEKPFKCSECEKCFRLKRNLVEHMRVHTGEKPFKCSRCEKCFRRGSNLANHVRVHTGEKPYKCGRCEKRFTQSSNLVERMRLHTGEKPYQCCKCDKYFSIKSGLTGHMRTHSDEKPYECRVCGKCVKSKSDLRKHMGVHTGEKPFPCSECEKDFRRPVDLKRHMRTHTGERPFKCLICHKCFTDKYTLVVHMRTHPGS